MALRIEDLPDEVPEEVPDELPDDLLAARPSGLLRGQRVRTPLAPLSQDGARRLIAAIVLRAVQEAEQGNGEAADWLATTGRLWCRLFLGIEDPGTMLPIAEARRRLASDPVEIAARQEHERQRGRAREARRRARQARPRCEEPE